MKQAAPVLARNPTLELRPPRRDLAQKALKKLVDWRSARCGRWSQEPLWINLCVPLVAMHLSIAIKAILAIQKKMLLILFRFLCRHGYQVNRTGVLTTRRHSNARSSSFVGENTIMRHEIKGAVQRKCLAVGAFAKVYSLHSSWALLVQALLAGFMHSKAKHQNFQERWVVA